MMNTLHYFGILLVFCIFGIVAGGSYTARAQSPNISYTAVSPVIKGYGSGTFTVRVQFTGACTGTKVRIGLPPGVTYETGSITTVSSVGGHTAAYDAGTSTPQSPVFDITGTVATADDIVFSIARRADCGSVQGSAFDSVYVTFTGGCTAGAVTAPSGTTYPTYNISEPDLGLLPVATITGAVLGTTANRTITINNGGAGSATDTLRFYIVYTGGAVANTAANFAITANSTSFDTTYTNGDTLFYKIYGVFGTTNPGLFENGESVVITEPMAVRACGTAANATRYGAGWGRTSATVCKVTPVTAQVAMATGTPNYSAFSSTRCPDYTNLCNAFDIQLAITNGGGGNAIAAGMYNVQLDFGMLSGTNINPLGLDTSIMSFYNVRFGACGTTVAIPASRVVWTANTGSTNAKAVMAIDLRDLFPVTDPDPDGAGGLADLDGDGFYDDLPGGNQVLRVTISVKAKDAPCNYYKYIPNLAMRPRYTNMCGTALTADARSATGAMNISVTIGSVSHIPANVVNNEPFRFSGKYTSSNNTNGFRTANTRYRWKVALPPCFSVAPVPDARYGSTTLTPLDYSIVSGGVSGVDTLVYTSPNNVMQFFSINLIFDCSGGCTGGSKAIWHYLEEVNDITASPECMMWAQHFCKSITTDAKCPAPCPEGPTVYRPVVRRADGSLGWTDNTLTTRQSAANIPAFDLSKALYLDTILINASMRQNDAADNLYIHIDLPRTSGGINKLTAVSLTAQVYRAGAAFGAGITSTAPVTTVSGSNQVINWNLSSGLPVGGLLPGDSVYATTRYVVATNSGLPTDDIQSGGRWYFYNLVGGDEKYCDSWIAEMYLTGTTAVNGRNAFTASGCNEAELGGSAYNLARRFSSSGLQYENEVRPGFYIDSVVIDVPSSYEIRNTWYRSARAITNTSAPSLGNEITTNVTPDYSSGTVHTFINNGSWRVPNITYTNVYGAFFGLRVQPTCASAGVQPTTVKLYVRDFYYAYGPDGTEPSGLRYIFADGNNQNNIASSAGTTQNITYSSTGSPNLVMQNLTGEVQATAPQEEWVLQLGNSGLNAAPYVWIAIPNHSLIGVTEVRDIVGGDTVVPAVPYAGGNMYRLLTTPGIGSGASRNYRIRFNYTACTPDSLLVLGGWNCGSFPVAPSGYLCSIDSIYLKLAPLQSQVQMGVVRQPGGSSEVDLCTTDYTDIYINSSSVSYLREPRVTFTLPVGITLTGTTAAVEYPRGSGITQNLPVSCTGSNCEVMLSGHTGIGTSGIPGTSNDGGNINNRQAVIRMEYTTDCNFVSGSGFRFLGWGRRVCGAPATNNGIANASTNGLNITGAAVTGTAGIGLSFAGGATVISCGTPITFNSVIVPLGSASIAGDTIIYTLPNGLGYAGNFTAAYPVVVSGGVPGATIVKVALPVGIADAGSVSYAFDVICEGTGCGAVNITAEYQRNGAELSCGGTPCGTPSRSIIKSEMSPAVTLSKPSLNIVSMRKLDASTEWAMGYWENVVKVVYQNNGTQAYTANTDTIEFYCNTTATTPFYKAPLTKNVAIGASDSDTYSIFIPVGTCAVGDYVEARIPAVTALGTPQCLCAADALLAAAPLPLDMRSFTAKSDACAVQLNWAYTDAAKATIKQLYIQRSADGHTYEQAAVLQGTAAAYTDVVPYAGVWMYRLAALMQDGATAYSPVTSVKTVRCAGTRINIYPNPASEKVQLVLQGESMSQSYELLDVTGRMIQSGTLKANSNNTIDVSAYAKGSYLLRVVIDGHISVHQVQIK